MHQEIFGRQFSTTMTGKIYMTKKKSKIVLQHIVKLLSNTKEGKVYIYHPKGNYIKHLQYISTTKGAATPKIRLQYIHITTEVLAKQSICKVRHRKFPCTPHS